MLGKGLPMCTGNKRCGLQGELGPIPLPFRAPPDTFFNTFLWLSLLFSFSSSFFPLHYFPVFLLFFLSPSFLSFFVSALEPHILS